MEHNSKKKIDRAREMLIDKPGFFKCPVCSKPMLVRTNGSLSCDNGHSFDFSKKGTLNLMTSATKTLYGKELFIARHQVNLAGLYVPLVKELAAIIKSHPGNIKNILDAGCGEGSYLYNLHNLTDFQSDLFLVGVDISKDSIRIAASNSADIIWCVADLAKLPFADQAFDMVLNILSPANYAEFKRMLNGQGIVVKVVPGREYLKELREILYREKSASDYSNQEVIRLFVNNMELIDKRHINFTFPVDDGLWPDLIKMTPLVWGSGEKRRLEILNYRIPDVTIDLVLLIGRKQT